MKNKTIPIIRLTSVIIFLIIATGFTQLSAAGEGEQQSFKSFVTYDLAGNTVNQEIFAANTVTLVNVWATFCPPCLQEMPGLGELSREFSDKGVGIVGIVTDVYPNQAGQFINVDKALQIVNQTQADYPHLLLSEDLMKTRLGNVQAVPETFFVDSNGNVVGKTHVGARSKTAWKLLVEQTLKAVQK